mgnify:CR=1 FL=1
MATATNNVIDLADPECLRREREKHFTRMADCRSARLEGQLLDSLIKGKIEELNRVGDELDKLRADRRKLLNSAGRETFAREWLRSNRPKSIADRLDQLTVAEQELRVEFAPTTKRIEWLKDRIDEAQGFMQRRQRAKLENDLSEAQGQLAEYEKRREALQNEKRELIQRCVSEAWPELEVEPSKHETTTYDENTRKPAGKRTSKTP